MNRMKMKTFIAVLITSTLVLWPKLHSQENSTVGTDGFGLPQIDITFLNPQDTGDACLDAKVYPWSWVDGRFCLIQDDMTPMCVSLANPKEIKNPNPKLIVDLPDGIDVIGGIHGMPPPEVIETANARKTWSVPIPPYYCIVQKKHIAGGFMRIALFCSLKPSDQLLDAVYYYKDDKTRQPDQHLKLSVLPPLPKVNKPSSFKIGALFGTPDMCFKGKSLELWADLMRRSGIDFVTTMDAMTVTQQPGVDRDSAEYYKAFNKCGIKVYLEPFRLGGWVYDMGYWLCRPLPKEAEFVRLDGTVAPTMASMRWVAHSPEFRKKLYDYLLDFAVVNKRCDSFAANWEPHPASMMDFSDDMLKDMAVFLGQDPNDIEKLGRLSFIKKNKDHLVAFRNKQLGDVMKTIYEVLREIEPKAGHELDIMPLVNYDFNKSFNNYPGDIGQYCRIISPFAYPATHFILKDYKGIVNRFSDSFPEFVSTIRKHKQWALEQNPQQPPKLYHCGDFNGSMDSICPPQQLRLQAILDMVYGYDAIGYYRFFMGFDGRYYHAIAKTCNDVSVLEPYLCKKDLKQINSASAEGYPGASVLDIDEGKWRPDFIDAGLLSDGQRRIVSIANMQERWESAVFWKLQEIPDGAYSVYDPLAGKQLAIDGKMEIPGSALRDGLHFKMPPNEIRILVIEPWNGNPKFTDSAAPDGSKTAFDTCKTAWLAEVENDKKKKAAVVREEPYKLTFEPRQNEAFKTYGQNNNIIVECFGQKFIIDVAHGAKLTSWTVDGFEMVRGDVLLRDRLWEEKKDVWKKGFMNTPYTVDSVNLADNELKLTFSCVYPHLPITMRKTFTFNRDCSIKVSANLRNTGGEITTIAYWVENWPSILDTEKVKDGVLLLPGEGGPFKSDCVLQSFYQFVGIPHDDLLALTPYKLQMQQQLIKSGEMVAHSPSRGVGYQFKAPFDKMAFYFSWGTLDCQFRTCDFIFRHVTLQPGEAWDVDFSLNAIKGDAVLRAITDTWK